MIYFVNFVVPLQDILINQRFMQYSESEGKFLNVNVPLFAENSMCGHGPLETPSSKVSVGPLLFNT